MMHCRDCMFRESLRGSFLLRCQLDPQKSDNSGYGLCTCNPLRIARLTAQIEEGGDRVVVGRELANNLIDMLINEGRPQDEYGEYASDCVCMACLRHGANADDITHDPACSVGRLRTLLDGKGGGKDA